MAMILAINFQFQPWVDQIQVQGQIQDPDSVDGFDESGVCSAGDTRRRKKGGGGGGRVEREGLDCGGLSAALDH